MGIITINNQVYIYIISKGNGKTLLRVFWEHASGVRSREEVFQE